MRNDEIDPKKIWQDQGMEHTPMDLDVQRHLNRLQAKTRRQLLGTVAGPLIAIFFYVFGMKSFPGLRSALQPLFALALIWSVAGLYFLNRRMWPGGGIADAGFTGLESCRREIDRRSRLLGRLLLWSFGPAVLALFTFILGAALIAISERGMLLKALPFMTLVAVWIVAYFILRLREQRALRREADDLNEIEGESRRPNR